MLPTALTGDKGPRAFKFAVTVIKESFATVPHGADPEKVSDPSGGVEHDICALDEIQLVIDLYITCRRAIESEALNKPRSTVPEIDAESP